MTNVTLTDPVAGTVIAAGLHTTNNSSLRSAINGGIDNNNIAASAGIVLSKLGQSGATVHQSVDWNGTSWVAADRPYIYDRVTTAVDVVSSVAETTIYSKAITGNDMSTNRVLRLSLRGDYLHNNIAGDTVTIRIKFGATTLSDSATAFASTLGANREPWRFDLELANLGATNSQSLEGSFRATLPAAAPTAGTGGLSNGITTVEVGGSSAIDTTANATLAVTAQWSASSANDSFKLLRATLELV